LINQVKTFISHEQLCDLLDVDHKKGLGNFELIYRPDVEAWLLVGESWDTAKEGIEVAERQ
jgi:hypothetical protein